MIKGFLISRIPFIFALLSDTLYDPTALHILSRMHAPLVLEGVSHQGHIELVQP